MVTGAALAGLVVVAAWIRFQFIVLYGGLEPSYDAWAQANYFGGVSTSYVLGAKSLREFAYPSLAYPPGYSSFLAVLQSIGFEDLQRLRYVQASLDPLVVIVVYALARKLNLNKIWSLCAAGFYGVYTPFAAGAGLIMAEAFSPGLILVSLWVTIWASRAPTTRRLAVLGGLLSINALIRPDLVLFPGLIALWLWTFGGVPRRPVLMAAFAGAFIVMALPWGIHNRLTHGVWVFTTVGGSNGLWQGLGEIPNDYGYHLSDDYTSVMLKSRGLRWQSPEADRFLRQEYFRAWREHPGFVLRVIGLRWKRILTESEQLASSAFHPLQTALDRWGAYVWGLAILAGFRRRLIWLVVAAPVIYALLSIGLVHYEARYVRYVQLCFFIAALTLLARLFEARRPYVQAAGTIVAVLVSGAAVIYAVGEAGVVRTQANALRLQQLMSDPAEFEKLRVVSATTVDDWYVDPGASMEREGSIVHVSAPAAGGNYLLARNVELPDTAVVGITYDVTVREGAVTVGLLDSTGHWLTNVNLAALGNHRRRLVVAWPGGNRVTVVVAGANASPTITRFDLLEAELRIR